MSKWLERLREHEKNRNVPPERTDKTDEIATEGILSVLSVRSGQDFGNFSLSDEDRQAAFEERAAILEYDEHLPREEAERLAHIQIFRQ